MEILGNIVVFEKEDGQQDLFWRILDDWVFFFFVLREGVGLFGGFDVQGIILWMRMFVFMGKIGLI